MTALHNVYRPEGFYEIVGQADVIKQLKGYIPNLPPTMLFVGPPGVGKTTTARVLAKEVGVLPVDFFEYNTASFRGIDTAREIEERIRYIAVGPKRIVFLDEAHKLTNDAQNALLKLLEEPPKGTHFILATTEPTKLLPTIRSRAAMFKFKEVSEEALIGLIEEVAEAEEYTLSEDVICHLVGAANGSARQALVLLGQIGRLSTQEQLAAVKESQTIEAQAIELARTLARRAKWKDVATILKGLQDDPEGVRRLILAYCSSILLNKDDPRIFCVMEFFEEPFFNTGKAGLVLACYRALQV